MAKTSKIFDAKLIRDDETSGCGIQLPFNPREAFGKVRAPVRVTINRHAYRTTTFSTGGVYWVPVNKANREAAGIAAGDRVHAQIELDAKPRVVTPPADLLRALKKDKRARAAWEKLSYSHQREYAQAIEEAKKPETRARRMRGAVEAMRGR